MNRFSKRRLIALLCGVVVWSLLAVGSLQAATPQEVLSYRLPKQRTAHLKDERAASSYRTSLEKLGCQVKVHGHAGHYDVSYHCPSWRQAEFDSHDAAHKWQKWLDSLGFETRHSH